MTLIDSVDSIIMLYSYSGFPDRSFTLFDKRVSRLPNLDDEPSLLAAPSTSPSISTYPEDQIVAPARILQTPDVDSKNKVDEIEVGQSAVDALDGEHSRLLRVKKNAMSTLSILLTLMSILVAFTYVPHMHLPSYPHSTMRPPESHLLKSWG